MDNAGQNIEITAHLFNQMLEEFLHHHNNNPNNAIITS